MKLHRYFIIILTVLFFISCTKQDVDSSTNYKYQQVTLKAIYNIDNYTKTSIDDIGNIYWSPNEEINIFYGGQSSKFISQNTEKTTSADFIGNLPEYSGNTTIIGLYPYDANATFSNNIITTTFDSIQVATANSFNEGLFPAIAKGTISNNSLVFYNICGGFKFTIGTKGINKIIVKGNNGEKIAGKIKVKFNDDETPSVTEILEGKTEIVFSATDGLTSNTTYYIVVIPTLFTNGLTIRFETNNGMFAEKIYNGNREIKRSTWGNLGEVDNGLMWKKCNAFTIDENGKQVLFAKGNLQAIVNGSEKVTSWKFAEHQYDYIGTSGSNYTLKNGMVDLFCWSTTNMHSNWGVNHCNASYSSGYFNDWGENEISGETGWYTLTNYEWNYLVKERANASSKIGSATVCNTKGVIILPDIFTDPMKNHKNNKFIPNETLDYTLNEYDSDDWTEMEQNGAIFLPSSGWRDGSGIYGGCSYWSSSKMDNGHAYIYIFNNSPFYLSGTLRYYGHSVRLVKDVSIVSE